MKSIKTAEPCNKTIPFPKLMLHDMYDSVFLMTGASRGTRVFSTNPSKRPLGETKTSLSSNYLSDFNGSICLDNSDSK